MRYLNAYRRAILQLTDYKFEKDGILITSSTIDLDTAHFIKNVVLCPALYGPHGRRALDKK